MGLMDRLQWTNTINISVLFGGEPRSYATQPYTSASPRAPNCSIAFARSIKISKAYLQYMENCNDYHT